jgi:hypothetical protein
LFGCCIMAWLLVLPQSWKSSLLCWHLYFELQVTLHKNIKKFGFRGR